MGAGSLGGVLDATEEAPANSAAAAVATAMEAAAALG